MLAVLVWTTAGHPLAGPFPADGIASRYPGDRDIAEDPAVLFAEGFERGPVEDLKLRWDTVGDEPGMSYSNEVPPGSAGTRSLVMERTAGPGPQLYTRLKNGEGGWGGDTVFARCYVKFDQGCGAIGHFGPCLGGNAPATRWPSVKAGHPTDGTKSFWSGIEPYGDAWVWDFYTYWCEMRGSPPRGQTWGNSFIRDPGLKVTKGEWICVEQMIRMNTLGDTDGEQALWIDGKLAAHLGKGFPKGLWTFDKFEPGKGGQGIRWNVEMGDRERFSVPTEGLPFEGFRWRTDAGLNVNFVWLYVYSEKPEGHRIKVWYDDLVVATEYIGPIDPKR